MNKETKMSLEMSCIFSKAVLWSISFSLLFPTQSPFPSKRQSVKLKARTPYELYEHPSVRVLCETLYRVFGVFTRTKF